MKRLRLIAALSLILSVLWSGFPSALSASVEYGDLNLDGKSDATDALMVLQYSVRLVELTTEQILAADVDDAGDINATDALLILQKSVSLIETFPTFGIPLVQYRIVFGNGYENVATELAADIQALTGVGLSVISEEVPAQPCEITVGTRSRTFLLEQPGYDDFRAFSLGDSLHLCAGSKSAMKTACHRLLEKMSSNPLRFKVSSLTFSYELPDRRVYIQDISRLALRWESEFTPPAWMGDFEEKYAALTDPGGRLMSCAHRGDMVYYPENSIEGLISAVRMGADMVEIDPRLTKDGVFVLMHDATLKRTTDFAEKAGKNGLPSSANLCDWTYEQLMQLNLKEGRGGTDAEVTPYKIPTLEEAFRVCANRIFIRLDVKKAEGSSVPFWDFEKDIWPLIERYQCYTTVHFTWQSFLIGNDYAMIKSYRKITKERCGKAMTTILPYREKAADLVKIAQNHGLDYIMRLPFDASTIGYDTYLSENADQLKAYRGKVRLYADVHKTSSSYPQNKESFEYYEALYQGGLNYQLVNHALLLCQYISQNCTPAAY